MEIFVTGDNHLCLDQQINQPEEQLNPHRKHSDSEIVWSALQLLILKIICKNLNRKK